ncbi:MAG: TatD family hydrolase, partial [Candidatus Caldatribacteriaceae bacterium]
GVYAALGVHPQEVKEEKPDFSELEKLLLSSRVMAVGEVGLDFYWEKRYAREQEEAFIAQIDLAERYNLPLIVHSRSAEERVLAILKERVHHVPVIWHCFSGSAEVLKEILSLGFYLSLSGIVTYPKAVALRKVVASLPLERVFLETDAPYLAPQKRRGMRNEPAFLFWTALFLADLWGIDSSALQERLFLNFQEVFGRGMESKMIQQELSKMERGYTI